MPRSQRLDAPTTPMRTRHGVMLRAARAAVLPQHRMLREQHGGGVDHVSAQHLGAGEMHISGVRTTSATASHSAMSKVALPAPRQHHRRAMMARHGCTVVRAVLVAPLERAAMPMWAMDAATLTASHGVMRTADRNVLPLTTRRPFLVPPGSTAARLVAVHSTARAATPTLHRVDVPTTRPTANPGAILQGVWHAALLSRPPEEVRHGCDVALASLQPVLQRPWLQVQTGVSLHH